MQQPRANNRTGAPKSLLKCVNQFDVSFLCLVTCAPKHLLVPQKSCSVSNRGEQKDSILKSHLLFARSMMQVTSVTKNTCIAIEAALINLSHQTAET